MNSWKKQKNGFKSFLMCASRKEKSPTGLTIFSQDFERWGNGMDQKSAIIQILEFENRRLYYTINDISQQTCSNTINLRV